MIALWLLPADKHDTQAMYKLHTCITYMSHTIHIKPAKQVMHRIILYRFVCRVRNTRRYAQLPTFSEITDHIWTPFTPNSLIWPIISIITNLNSIYVSLLTPMADNRPVGVDRVTTSSIPIDRKHSLNDPHVQLITSTVHIADLFKDNRSHLPPPHV